MEPLVPTVAEARPIVAPLPESVAAIAPEPDYPIAPPREPRRRQRGGRDKSSAPIPAPAPQAEPRREARPTMDRDRGEEDDRKVVGFGADLPAFLSRPAAPRQNLTPLARGCEPYRADQR